MTGWFAVYLCWYCTDFASWQKISFRTHDCVENSEGAVGFSMDNCRIFASVFVEFAFHHIVSSRFGSAPLWNLSGNASRSKTWGSYFAYATVSIGIPERFRFASNNKKSWNYRRFGSQKLKKNKNGLGWIQMRHSFTLLAIGSAVGVAFWLEELLNCLRKKVEYEIEIKFLSTQI